MRAKSFLLYISAINTVPFLIGVHYHDVLVWTTALVCGTLALAIAIATE